VDLSWSATTTKLSRIVPVLLTWTFGG